MLWFYRVFCERGDIVLGGGPMRRVFDFFLELPESCSRMSFDELLLSAALLTLVITVILMISGRKLA